MIALSLGDVVLLNLAATVAFIALVALLWGRR